MLLHQPRKALSRIEQLAAELDAAWRAHHELDLAVLADPNSANRARFDRSTLRCHRLEAELWGGTPQSVGDLLILTAMLRERVNAECGKDKDDGDGTARASAVVVVDHILSHLEALVGPTAPDYPFLRPASQRNGRKGARAKTKRAA